MNVPQPQSGPATAAAPVAARQVAVGRIAGGKSLQPDDSVEIWNPKTPLGRALVPIVTSWPFTCLWVSTVFLAICYVGGDFKNRTFDETWNPAYNPARLFQPKDTKANATQLNPVQAIVRSNSK